MGVIMSFPGRNGGCDSRDEVLEWFNVKAYGMPNPGTVDTPTEGRSHGLRYYKKALSTSWSKRIISGMS